MPKICFEIEIEFEGTYRPGRPANLSTWPGDPPESEEWDVEVVTRLGPVTTSRKEGRTKWKTEWHTLPESARRAICDLLAENHYLSELCHDALREDYESREA